MLSVITNLAYEVLGEEVGATPDGRLANEPVCDSAGAVFGRDKEGSTALIRSVTRLDQIHAPGTLVFNIRFTKKMLADKESRDKVKALIKTYFAMGGMQIQINVVDQETLADAIEHPECHENLIIRIGGYSEYFNRLSDKMKLTILERTAHEA